MLTGLKRLFKLTRTTVVLLVVVCTLGFNLLTFAFAPLANMMLAATERLALRPALAAASELTTLRDSEKAAQQRAARLEAERKAAVSNTESLRGELDDERRRAAQRGRTLRASEARVRQLRTDLDGARGQAARLGDELTEVTRKLDRLRDGMQIDRLTARIIQRSGVNALRNLASMPLESLPLVGALTIASVTALEIRDACQTAVELEELRRLANLPPADASKIREACETIPTVGGLDELTLPQCREHERKVRAELGLEASDPIRQKCDCIELPNGCPGENEETLEVSLPIPEMP